MAAKREVEAKIILDSCSELGVIEKRIAEHGGSCGDIILEEDVYFQHPCRDFAETDEALRLRRSSEGVRITYKGPKEGGEVKARVEVETGVESFEAMNEILVRLGFKPVLAVRKRRRYCKLGSVLVTLDEVEGLGCFVEVEADDEKRVMDVVKMLGLEGRPRTILSYLEMLIERIGLGKAKA